MIINFESALRGAVFSLPPPPSTPQRNPAKVHEADGARWPTAVAR